MRLRVALPGLLALALLMSASATLADPPAHAPAHGYRSKAWKSPKNGARVPAPRSGVEIVFDSERGVYVGIGLPDLFFHEGTYYRQREGRWQASATGDGDWRSRATFRVPDAIVAASKRAADEPVPAAPRN